MTKWIPFTLSATTMAFACASTIQPETSNPPQPRKSQGAVNVTRLYEQTCAKCHGSKGEGGGAGTKSLNTKEKFDQKYDKPFFDAIKNGVPDMGMEAYKPTMSDPEIWALVVHIRELQAEALRKEFGSPKAVNGIYPSKHHPYKIETVIESDAGLKTPWAVDWLPDGRMLVTNRGGVMNIVKDNKLGPPVENMPPTIEIGQGGLMEVSVHPDYAKNGWIYLGLTDPAKNGAKAGMTKIVRGKLKFNGDQATWTSQETIFETEQSNYSGSGVHYGCRIVFDKSGHVFFSIGERGSGNLAQDLTKPNGKIFRVNENGSIPSDNPFAGSADKSKNRIPAIWSYGHRNPQGLVFDLEGNLWDTEHGPRGGDEVNRIQKAANYGWPDIAFSINYNDSPYAVPWPTANQNYTNPVFRWLPSIGASGLDVARGRAFPKWKGDLLAGGLSGANVDRIRILNDKVIEREELVHGMGRVRDVATAPDGTVYVVLNGPDKIVRLVP